MCLFRVCIYFYIYEAVAKVPGLQCIYLWGRILGRNSQSKSFSVFPQVSDLNFTLTFKSVSRSNLVLKYKRPIFTPEIERTNNFTFRYDIGHYLDLQGLSGIIARNRYNCQKSREVSSNVAMTLDYILHQTELYCDLWYHSPDDVSLYPLRNKYKVWHLLQKGLN